MNEVKEMRGELPSNRAEVRKLNAAEREAEKAKKEEQFKGVVARLGNTADGQFFFRWLMKECGFAEPILGINPANGEIDEKRTLYQAMRLNLYVKVRKYLTLKTLMEVEHE